MWLQNAIYADLLVARAAKHVQNVFLVCSALLLGRNSSANITGFYAHNVDCSARVMLKKLVFMYTKFTNINITVNTTVLRHEPITLADVTRAKIWLATNLVLDTVYVKIWREIFDSTAWNTYVRSALRTTEKPPRRRGVFYKVLKALKADGVMARQDSGVAVLVHAYRTLKYPLSQTFYLFFLHCWSITKKSIRNDPRCCCYVCPF